MGGRWSVWVVVGVIVIGGLGAGWWFLGAEPLPESEEMFAVQPMILEEVDALASAGAMHEATGRLETWLNSPEFDSAQAGDVWFRLGQLYYTQGQLMDARTAYQTVVEQYPGSRQIGAAQHELETVNMGLLFSPVITPNDQVHVVKSGDTLSQIAKQYHTTVELIRRANRLSGDLIRPGMELKVSAATFNLLIDKSRHVLFLKSGEEFVKTYQISTGEHGSTPVGEFAIINKLEDPVWYKAGAIVPPQSSDNILGTRWMGLSKQGYGIHGTTMPEDIGKQITAGCVRMHNKDVEELYAVLPTGTAVTIVD